MVYNRIYIYIWTRVLRMIYRPRHNPNPIFPKEGRLILIRFPLFYSRKGILRMETLERILCPGHRPIFTFHPSSRSRGCPYRHLHKTVFIYLTRSTTPNVPVIQTRYYKWNSYSLKLFWWEVYRTSFTKFIL